jgi:hypothetical protein
MPFLHLKEQNTSPLIQEEQIMFKQEIHRLTKRVLVPKR